MATGPTNFSAAPSAAGCLYQARLALALCLVRRRLGGEAGPLSRFPDKPKGMWHRTYERLCEKVIGAEIQAEQMFEVQAGRLLARLDRHKPGFWA